MKSDKMIYAYCLGMTRGFWDIFEDFHFYSICTNWLLPTIYKIISSVLVVMGEEKSFFFDKN